MRLLLAARTILVTVSFAADYTVDPVSRAVHLTYEVPANAPDEVIVKCSWKSGNIEGHGSVPITPLLSETAINLVATEDWSRWRAGECVERNAAGLVRTVVFTPALDDVREGVLDAVFHIAVADAEGRGLAAYDIPVRSDTRDVVFIDDWARVTNADALNEADGWTWPGDAPESTSGTALRGPADTPHPLPQLSYPLDRSGWYAIHVATPSGYGIKLRLSSDERSDLLSSSRPGQEVFWRWAKMDRQHLVLSQPHAYTGWASAAIDYVKLVPLSEAQVAELEASFGEPDKFVAGYFEPYSWAFVEHVMETLQHRMPLTTYPEARIGLVDIQIGRFGMKSVFETRRTDQLLYSTIGDPIGDVVRPTTDNVGRMQQFTNTLDAELRYAKELGLLAHANFGASNCYPGSPLQGDFSKNHPEWVRGSQLRFEVPEVRAYALGLYREALEIGASGISIDFCRYPETIDVAETATGFLRELRVLADEFSAKRGALVPILVRFPGTGVRLADRFDYATWARDRLVDYVCPSNIQGRHMHIDMAPYFKALKDTDAILLPELDALGWGLPFPGPFLWRAQQVYEQGAPGIYVYQADGRVLGTPGDRRTMRRLASSEGIRDYWVNEAMERPRRSKGIFITRPHEFGVYHGYERIRIWTEGVPLGPVEVYLDNQLVNRMEGPPYLVGTEGDESDDVIPSGDYTLRIRAQDGEGWLEQEFAIQGAG